MGVHLALESESQRHIGCKLRVLLLLSASLDTGDDSPEADDSHAKQFQIRAMIPLI